MKKFQFTLIDVLVLYIFNIKWVDSSNLNA